jgi:Zn-dependent protease
MATRSRRVQDPPYRPLRSVGAWRLGRIAGVDVDVNWTWAIAFALLSMSLADGVFPAADPGLSHGTYLAMAIVSSVAYFASIVLHEFGHALEARREGVPTDRVTLWLFGGVAQLRGRFPSAGAEFRIAVAGPLVTLVLVGVFLGAGELLALPAAVDGVLSWLGYINAVLLAFNLLPALPLDGGRVLRAALWAKRRDFVSATRTAADVSRVLATLMIVVGLIGAVAVGFGGLWLALVGWFILIAGAAERRMVG